jgi:hypothetical protein
LTNCIIYDMIIKNTNKPREKYLAHSITYSKEEIMKKEDILAVINQANGEKKAVRVSFIDPLDHNEESEPIESPISIFEFGFAGEDSDNVGNYFRITFESVISIEVTDSMYRS